MSLPDAAPPTSPEGKRLESLPPVEAPTASFILQLFLIPLAIVSIVVLLWLSFSWLAHMGRDNPDDLVKALQRGDDSSWQRAYELADLLRSPDPKYDALRRDTKLAGELAAFLGRDLDVKIEGSGDKVRIMRRMFLCRALGSFALLDGLPVLMRAAKQESHPLEVEVRIAALESITTLADSVGPQTLAENAELMKLLLAASRERSEDDPAPAAVDGNEPSAFRPHAEVRAVAAFALGVIGSDEAIARLRQMLHDPYANARYNAATGLARRGDAACLPVLKEMLDPDNNQAAKDEKYADEQDRKRATVLLNGIRAALIFAQSNPDADLSGLKQSLKTLAQSPLEQIESGRIQLQSTAVEALRLMEKERKAD
ncbi:MAG: HEAT repeat domain-containing protein [Pirellulaceae bacterium]|nr:HEAT repeat domain-containing protein [Pirellulaceae bacterium]